MKKFFSPFFVILSLFFAVFVISCIKIIPQYNSDISENIVAKNIFDNYSFSAWEKQNVWYVGFDKNRILEQFSDSSNFCVQFFVNGKKYQECLDRDGEDATEKFYTFPIVTDASNVVAFEILYQWKKVSSFENVTLYSSNTLPIGEKIAFAFPDLRANDMVISRASWGADETLRYANHPRQIAIAQATEVTSQKTKSLAQIAAAKKIADINTFVGARLKDFVTTERITYENGNKLVWPIQKVNKMNKIVVHHTADKIDGRTDEEMLRAIYSYHAVTRGWGDIGYNYIVGQNGRIYEGRAGGDYVVGAHASYNNIGAVGISVLGTYDTTGLNFSQEMGLKSIIDATAKKYNINLDDTVMGFYPCSSSECYPIKVVYTKALLAHRDVGVTSCPGNMIYNNINRFREEILQKIPQNNSAPSLPSNPQNNAVSLPIRPTISNMFGENITPSPAPITPTITPQIISNSVISVKNTGIQNPSSENFSQKNPRIVLLSEKNVLSNTIYSSEKIGIKLSYPKDFSSISLRTFAGLSGEIFLDDIRQNLDANTEITVSPSNGNLRVQISGQAEKIVKKIAVQSAVVEISSWYRKPEWDTKNRYNDNIFRDTIEIRNENNSLIVINRLPLEFYLKWLGEVSDGDLSEKIKTIIVAARGYARFYMSPNNRKYNTMLFDGSDDPNSFQKYLGYDYERRSPNVAKLVDATNGEVIYYNNVLIKPWYFSRSAGRTLSYENYCLQNNGTNCENIPYLQSVADPGSLWEVRAGHGVGISGLGATHFARMWWDYKQIIQYFLSWVEIRK